MQTLITILQEAFDKKASSTETKAIALSADFEFLLKSLQNATDDRAAILALANFNVDCSGFSTAALGNRQLAYPLTFHNYVALKKNKGFV